MQARPKFPQLYIVESFQQKRFLSTQEVEFVFHEKPRIGQATHQPWIIIDFPELWYFFWGGGESKLMFHDVWLKKWAEDVGLICFHGFVVDPLHQQCDKTLETNVISPLCQNLTLVGQMS